MKKTLALSLWLFFFAIPVYGQVVAQGAAGKNPWLVSATGSWLTDAQLRAVAVAISGTVTANQGGTWTVGVSGSVAVTGTFWQATQPVSGTFWQATQPVAGTVTTNQGTANTVANSWPSLVTDGVDTAQVVSTANGLSTTVKGLVTQSVMWTKNNDGSVSEWNGGGAPTDSGLYPAVRALRTIRKVSSTSLNFAGADISVPVATYHLESIVIKLVDVGFVGTLEVYGNVNGSGVIFNRVFDPEVNAWISTPITTPNRNVGIIVPSAGYDSIGVRVSAYTSGSMTAIAEGGPGSNALYTLTTLTANNGVDIGDVTVNNAAGASAVNVQDGGNSLTVDGPVTDTQLRAMPVPVSGTVATGGLTDAELRATAVPVSGTFFQATQPVSGTFWQTTQPVSGTVASTQSGTYTVQPGNTANTTAWLVKELQAGTPTLTNVAGSATSVTCLALNTSRLGATIYNDSSAVLYIKFGATASTTSFTIKVYQDGFVTVPFGYTGTIDCIWSNATGAARVTEVAQ